MGRTQEITEHEGNSSHQRSEEMNTRDVSIGHSYAQMSCRAALTSPPDSSHSRTQQLLGLEPPSDPHLPPRAWDGHTDPLFGERFRSRTPENPYPLCVGVGD